MRSSFSFIIQYNYHKLQAINTLEHLSKTKVTSAEYRLKYAGQKRKYVDYAKAFDLYNRESI